MLAHVLLRPETGASVTLRMGCVSKTNSMEYSSCGEADGCSAIQEIPSLLRTA
jgi:hypothetical protein